MFLADADTANVYQIVREGGPFVVAFTALVIGFVVFWKIVGKPTLSAMLTISGDFSKASNEFKQGCEQLEKIAARQENVVSRLEEHIRMRE